MANIAKLMNQLEGERKLVSFDSYDLTVRQLIDMYESGDIFVPPEYQRQFVWNTRRQSELVESVFLGIPVPNLFMAMNADATWEVVDGVQRLSSIAHFIGGEVLLRNVERDDSLKIEKLRKLGEMNGMCFCDLPKSMQLMFYTRPLRVTVLNDKSDLEVRYDLFERLNTGGVSLTNQEIRNCVFRGPFNESIKRLAQSENFKSVVKLKPADASNGTKEELVLRFFAYRENYKFFEHSVEGFLNDFMRAKVTSPLPTSDYSIFASVFDLLAEWLPKGLVRGTRAITPLNLYEAVSVGLSLALEKVNGDKSLLRLSDIEKVVNSDELKILTTGATNSRSRVVGRIEYVRDALT